ncbi:MAG: ABC transporter permease, partial [Acidobacteria bacterium]|nr:ABC transporter permease [Acidobacteriota bacterium]
MLGDLFQHVFDSLLRNKLRSFLTMAGIAWGVASIVLIVAMGDGFRDGQRKNMRGLGENLVIVFGGRTEKQAGGQRAGRRIRLTYDDVRAIRAECYLVSRVVPELQGEVRAASPFNSGTFEVSGSEPEFNQLRTIPLAAGRFFNERDEAEAQRVCVIGDKVRTQLFAQPPGVLGAEIRLNGVPFRIAGVMADKNQNSSYSGRDVNKIFLPYSTMARDLPPKDPTHQPGYLSNLIYQPRELGQWKAAQEQVRRIVGRNHAFDAADDGAIRMWDTIENAQLVDNIFTSMTAFLCSAAHKTWRASASGPIKLFANWD